MTTNETDTQNVYECPSCDFTTDNKSGVAIHHKATHGESISWGEYDCVQCGTTVKRRRCEVGDIVYCSTDCESKHKTKLPPEEHPRWNGGGVTVECCICGKEKEVEKYRLERSEKFHCDSLECRSEFLKGHEPWNKGDNDRVVITCDQCGTKREKQKYKVERDSHHFCSKGCHNKWMSENQHGPNHHQWTGGRRDYGPGWNEHTKHLIRERQRWECFDCGISQKESKEKSNRKLHVHHLVEPSSETNPAVHNAPRNLVALCVSCHIKTEQKNSVVQSLWKTMEMTKL